MNSPSLWNRIDQSLFYPEDFIRDTFHENRLRISQSILPLSVYLSSGVIEWMARNNLSLESGLQPGSRALAGMVSVILLSASGFFVLGLLLTILFTAVGTPLSKTKSIWSCLSYLLLILAVGNLLRAGLVAVTGDPLAFIAPSLLIPDGNDWNGLRQFLSLFDLFYLAFVYVLTIVLQEFGRMTKFESCLWILSFFLMLQGITS